MPSQTYLILRTTRRVRLEGRKAVLQDFLSNLGHLRNRPIEGEGFSCDFDVWQVIEVNVS